jgi:hypothetical protein
MNPGLAVFPAHPCDPPSDGGGELWSELQELVAEAAEALGDDLIAVLWGGDGGQAKATPFQADCAQPACDHVHLFLVTTTTHPRGIEKMPHLARRYEHRLRVTVDFSRPITPAMIGRWPPRLIWQELALGHRVLYGPADVLTSRVPRHVLDPLPTIEATRLLLNSGAGLIGAARMSAGMDAAADAILVARLYYNCAQSLADALLLGCQRFCVDPERKLTHLLDIARFEPIVDQSGAVVHLRRAHAFRNRAESEFVVTHQHLQEMAQDWQRVFLWIESVRLGLRFQSLEKYAAWPDRRVILETPLLSGLIANLRRRRLGWVHPSERVFRMLAVAISDLAKDESRFPFTADAALEGWRDVN